MMATLAKPNEIIVIGAGLVGLMMAIYLARRGYQVTLYEKSQESAHFNATNKASDLNLSARACLALQELGLLEQLKQDAMPTKGRVIFFDAETSITLPHSYQDSNIIYNVSRPVIYKILFNAAQKEPGINIHFEHELLTADCNKQIFTIKNNEKIYKIRAPFVLGCDGSYSLLREALNRENAIEGIHLFSYKHYQIPNVCTSVMDPEWMYQWNDPDFVLMGHPDKHNQFNGAIVCKPQFTKKFEVNATLQIGCASVFIDQQEAFHKLKSVKVPVQQAGGVLLLGDAAHGMLPFLAQGINSGFEDCRLLNYYLNLYQDNLEMVMKKYIHDRQIDTNAMIDMSIVEYRSLVPGYDKQRVMFYEAMRDKLHERYPTRFFHHRYLLAFTHTPYAEIMRIKKIQMDLLQTAYETFGRLEHIDWRVMDKFMRRFDVLTENDQETGVMTA